MNEDRILDGFMEGFAKAAEAAGFTGDQIGDLLRLSVALSQKEAGGAAFDAGFDSVMRRA